MSKIVVLLPDAHRLTIAVKPSTALTEILDEACKRSGLDVMVHFLKHHNKKINLAVPFRLSGLPNNCTLELEKQKVDVHTTPSNVHTPVDVAVQSSHGTRKTISCLSNSTIWDVLVECESIGDESFTKAIDNDSNTICVQCLNHQVIGERALRHKTLAGLGASGRVLLRHSERPVSVSDLAEINKSIDEEIAKRVKLQAIFEKKLAENRENETIEIAKSEAEAMEVDSGSQRSDSPVHPPDMAPQAEIVPVLHRYSQPAALVEPRPLPRPQSGTSRLQALQQMLNVVDSSIVNDTDLPFDLDVTESSTSSSSVPDFANFKFPEDTKGMDLRILESSSSSFSRNVAKCDRNAIIYSLDDVETFDADSELPDNFFDITVDDVKVMQKINTQEISHLQNRMLVSDDYIKERNVERKSIAWKFTVIRITFPDRNCIQANFNSVEPVSRVYEFVLEFLTKSLTIELYVPPNCVVENKTDQNLIEANLSPAASLMCRLKSSSIDGKMLIDFDKFTHLRKSHSEAMTAARSCLSQNTKYIPFTGIVESAPEMTSKVSKSDDSQSDKLKKLAFGKGLRK